MCTIRRSYQVLTKNEGTYRSGKGGVLCDPGSELRVGRREKKMCEDNEWDEQKNKLKIYITMVPRK